MPIPLDCAFVAGPRGPWRIDSVSTIAGIGLPPADRLQMLDATDPATRNEAAWVLRGITSNTRYTNRAEVSALTAKQAGLARPHAKCAALIPIRKTAGWWDLAQDERRFVFEEQSRHIAIGLDYLPGVARRLHHSREIGEPFDFLTWFEFPCDQRDAFDRLVERLRRTAEWRYVDREVDIRLSRLDHDATSD